QYVPYPDAETNLAQCNDLAGRLGLQSEEEIANYAAANSCAPTGAISTVEAATGAVRVMASGLPFDVDQFDLAVQGRRNPGSSFKPFTLMAALESPENITLGSYYRGSSPMTLECPYVCSELGNKWKVSNAGGSRAVLSLEQATSSSVNVVYAQVALEIGPEAIVDMAHRMGIESELRPVPSITLGTSEVTPLEMASAYTNFATNGRYTKPYLVARILDSSGDVIYEHENEYEQVGDPRMFAAARRPLSKVPTGSGTAPRANIDRPQGGKTGTHQDYKDAWYVGFVPQYATAVWVGFEADQIPLTNVTINGRVESRIFGGTAPAPMWADFMSWYLQDVEPADFPEPDGDLGDFFRTPSTTVPSVIGMDRGSAVAAISKAKLFPSVVEVPSLEPEGLVIGQGPGGGATVPQGSGVTIQVSTGQPPTGVLPDVAGQGFDAALAALQEFNAENRLELAFVRANQEVENPNRVGTVLRLEPGAGTEVGFGAQVVIVVGVAPSNPEPPPPESDG
ncbi:MAG: penicillin-binding transpeptidase domain-containing protein, partial [Acidimicrobiia bacterium]|nr:penicillin-binding transpeptidase domain-containing protein [Acidimicrobiia bacterium]